MRYRDACDFCGTVVLATTLCVHCRAAGYCSATCLERAYLKHRLECGRIVPGQCSQSCFCKTQASIPKLLPLPHFLDRKLCRAYASSHSFHSSVTHWLQQGRPTQGTTHDEAISFSVIRRCMDVLVDRGAVFDNILGVRTSMLEYFLVVGHFNATVTKFLIENGSFSLMVGNDQDQSTVIMMQLTECYLRVYTLLRNRLADVLVECVASFLFVDSTLRIIQRSVKAKRDVHALD